MGAPLDWRPGGCQWLECTVPLGYQNNMYGSKRRLLCSVLHLSNDNSHCRLQMLYKTDTTSHSSSYAEVFHVDIFSPEMRCIFFLFANFLPLKQKLYFVLHLWNGRQYCLLKGNQRKSLWRTGFPSPPSWYSVFLSSPQRTSPGKPGGTSQAPCTD